MTEPVDPPLVPLAAQTQKELIQRWRQIANSGTIQGPIADALLMCADELDALTVGAVGPQEQNDNLVTLLLDDLNLHCTDHAPDADCEACRLQIERHLAERGPSQPPEPEICICAAVRMDDGIIFRGHRHDDCIITAGKRGYYTRQEHQGFVTSRNRFVGREEGAALQNAAGIVSADHGMSIGELLFSEDLYSTPIVGKPVDLKLEAAGVPSPPPLSDFRMGPDHSPATEAARSQRILANLVTARTACDNYTRPDGVMGGPCLTCGLSQPEHTNGQLERQHSGRRVASQSGQPAGREQTGGEVREGTEGSGASRRDRDVHVRGEEQPDGSQATSVTNWADPSTVGSAPSSPLPTVISHAPALLQRAQDWQQARAAANTPTPDETYLLVADLLRALEAK